MNQPTLSPKKIAAIVIFGVLSVIVLIIFLSQWYGTFSIHKTPYKSAMLSSLQGDYIYSYSGTSFYKTNFKNQDDPIILSQGLRLPKIETGQWVGDEGIVLTFANSGVIRSAVETSLTTLGEKWDEDTTYYAWYLDFKTNQLHLINRYGIAGQKMYYSPENKGVYYVAYSDTLSEEDQEESLPLHLFSLENKTSKIIVKNLVAANNLQHISKCPNGGQYIVCTIEAVDNEYYLYGISSDTKTKLTDKPFNNITPTAVVNVYIGTLNQTNPESSEEDDELKADLYRIDLETKKVSKLNNVINSSRSILANTTSGDNFYVFEPAVGKDSDEIGYISGSKNLLGFYGTQIKGSKTDSESKSILGPFSRGVNGESMYHDVEGDTFFITPSNQAYKPATLSEDQVKSSLKPCFDKYTKGYTYTPELKQFKINVLYDSNFTKNITSFSQCAGQISPKTSNGYLYIFLGVSTTDGRYVTD